MRLPDSGSQRYRELLDLYHGKNSHEKAIALLRRCVIALAIASVRAHFSTV